MFLLLLLLLLLLTLATNAMGTAPIRVIMLQHIHINKHKAKWGKMYQRLVAYKKRTQGYSSSAEIQCRSKTWNLGP